MKALLDNILYYLDREVRKILDYIHRPQFWSNVYRLLPDVIYAYSIILMCSYLAKPIEYLHYGYIFVFIPSFYELFNLAPFVIGIPCLFWAFRSKIRKIYNDKTI